MTTLDFAENVPVQIGNRISQRCIEGIAVEKYKSCGLGITFEDIQIRFRVKKGRAQRSIKYYYAKKVLFTAEELISIYKSIEKKLLDLDQQIKEIKKSSLNNSAAKAWGRE
jgi:hypothetical protein